MWMEFDAKCICVSDGFVISWCVLAERFNMYNIYYMYMKTQSVNSIVKENLYPTGNAIYS